MTGYSYFGLVIGKAKLALALLTVTALPSGSHVAVWLGASTPDARAWVQAGVEQTSGQTEPSVYIEEHAMNGRYSLTLYPGTAGRVRLQERFGRYRVTIGGHQSRWVWVPHATRIACMESMNGGRGIGLIGHQLVRH